MKRDAKKSIGGIERWFKKNPDRRVCRAEFWCGKQHSVRRGHVKEDIELVLDEALAENKKNG